MSFEFGSGNRGLLLLWVTNQNKVTGTTINISTNVNILNIQNLLTDFVNAKKSKGTEKTTTGVVVLEYATKAMVLPKVEHFI